MKKLLFTVSFGLAAIFADAQENAKPEENEGSAKRNRCLIIRQRNSI